jgi:hypothetical protein
MKKFTWFVLLITVVALIVFAASTVRAQDKNVTAAWQTGYTPTVDVPAPTEYQILVGPTEASVTPAATLFKQFAVSEVTVVSGENQHALVIQNLNLWYAIRQRNTADGNWSGLSNVIEYVPDIPIALPTIETHPESVSLTVGESTVFNVTVTGTGPFTYAWWYKKPGGIDWILVPDRTGPSNEINNVTIEQSGTQIRCVISNLAGPVTTNPATLTVNTVIPQPPPPPINFKIISGAIQGLRQDIDTRLAVIQAEVDKATK